MMTISDRKPFACLVALRLDWPRLSSLRCCVRYPTAASVTDTPAHRYFGGVVWVAGRSMGDGQHQHPALIKRQLKLDDVPSWVVLTEGNEFVWPGPDLRRLPGA
jgi:hypothetical protein